MTDERESATRQAAQESQETGSLSFPDQDERVLLPHSRPFSIPHQTAKIRQGLAIGLGAALVLFLASDILLAVLHSHIGLTLEQERRLMRPVLSTVTTLFAAAIGFYFGDRSSR